MRSAVYRRTGMLRTVRAHSRLLIRPLSSSTYDDQTPTPPSFPLYRPALAQQPLYEPRNTQYTNPGSLPSDRKIRKATKIQLTEKAIQDLPELEEDDLRSFYVAVMESGRPLDNEDLPRIEDGKKMSREERTDMIEGLAKRLMGPVEGEAGPSRLPAFASHQSEMIMGIVEKLRAIRLPVNEPEAGPRVSLGLVSKTEWGVLLDEMAGRGGLEAESMLDLMSTHGTYPDTKQITQVMEAYAREGRVGDVARIYNLLSQSGNAVTNSQHDLLIEAHLQHSPPQVYPAVNLMQSLATTGKPLPQSSYDILLSHLTTSQSTSQTRSLAWDLFANMRLTAHPTPNLAIYSTMISACASSRDPQPERARDLWIELNESLSPERREYDAIIRALSSTKSTYLEAFDLFRQMLAKHTEETFVPFEESTTGIEKWSRFVPTAETFVALLEGTKRAGDLNRARWVLKEVVRLQGGLDGRGWRGVGEELMSGVFMTYASWKPIVRRQIVKEGKGKQVETVATDPATDSATLDLRDQYNDVTKNNDTTKTSTSTIDTNVDQMRGSTSIKQTPNPAQSAPQTSADAIREAKVLFDQIIQDTQPDAKGPFNHVLLTTRLINSYLSVHLAHSPSIASAKEAWDEIWSLVGEKVKPNGWSMMQILERCSAGELGRDRGAATQWAKEIWEQYLVFLHENESMSISPKKQYYLGLGPRQIERSYRSIIRALSLSPNTPTEDSIAILRQFHTAHPPTSILDGYSATPSTPFQIRLVDRTSMAESDIPPHILWGDIDVLHQRLVREGKKGELGWLKWVCKSYEVALRKRRRWRLKGKGEEGRVMSRLRKGDDLERVEGGPIREEQEGQEAF